MTAIVRIDDSYKPKAGDVVMVLEDEGVLLELRLVRQSEPECPYGCCAALWFAEQTQGDSTEVEIGEDDILGEVIGHE